MMSNLSNNRLLSGIREELDVDLLVSEGHLPKDLHGFVYINSAVGSVNSQGLPYPELKEDGTPNPEFGTPIFNGDGFMLRLDLNHEDKIFLRTRLMKTPSFWADFALREGGPASKEETYQGKAWRFFNTGLGRFSLQLGQCNPLNVAVLPVQFAEGEPIRMIATYDAGRPWEIDPDSLEVKAPIIRNEDTVAVMPEWLRRFPFKGIMSTAHPVFDAQSQELFLVNFLKSTGTMLGLQRILFSAFKNPEKTRQKVLAVIEKAKEIGGKAGIRSFLDFVEGDPFEEELKEDQEFREVIANIRDKVSPDDGVFLIKWTGSPEVQKWRIRCEGKNITIMDTMHQMGMTEQYIILQDSSFKFNLSLMFNLLRPEYPELDSMLRDLLTQPMRPYSHLYFVKRSDLTPENETVEAVKATIPLECVHFSANYKEKDGLITIMTANNTATCPAEWMRHFDKLKRTGQTIDKKWLGFFNAGPMDVGRVGRFVFDPQTGELIDDKSSVLFEKGKVEASDFVNGHTWAVGLHSYKGYEEVSPRPEEIRNIYWQMYGLDRELVSEFIFELYRDYPHREVSIEEMEQLSDSGIPMGLARVNHAASQLKIEDFYLFPMDYHMRSIQFVPKHTPQTEVPEDQNGYLICNMNVPLANQAEAYQSEFWIWEAQDLAKGPVCKLHHPDFKFAFTLHSVWTPTAVGTNPVSQVDVIDDLSDQISSITHVVRQKKVEDFMNAYVYPHFADQKNAVADKDPLDLFGRLYRWILWILGLKKKLDR
ncbi:MAG: carotenoid oxygenase family protein [Bacteroidota bacterium]